MTPAELRAIADTDAIAAIRCLAAAERAVEEGRMNLAKILRASALSSRARAMALERVAARGEAATDTLAALDGGEHAVIRALAGNKADRPSSQAMGALAGAAATRSAILARSVTSLETSRDVPENVVAQLIWCCAECGALFESARPEVCAVCGSFAGDFELFAPFYSGTAERLSRRQPDEIIAMLRGDTAALRDALGGAPEETLRRRPAPGEWCMAEIAGHMVDIAALFNRRLTAALDPAADVPAERSPLPWRLLEGQGYDAMPRADLLRLFGDEIARALTMIDGLGETDWRRNVDMVGGKTRLIDMASWLANHNASHRQQIVALRDDR